MSRSKHNRGEWDPCAGRVKSPKRLGHLHPDILADCNCSGFVKTCRRKDRRWSRISRAKNKRAWRREWGL